MPNVKAQHFITRYHDSELAKVLREVHGTKFDAQVSAKPEEEITKPDEPTPAQSATATVTPAKSAVPECHRLQQGNARALRSHR